MKSISETCLVALSLSAVARLHQAFLGTTSPMERQRFLLAAADALDKTLPFPDLKAELNRPGVDQVAGLITGRLRIAAVPPALWRTARVGLNELGTSHYSGLRALDRALRKDFSTPKQTWEALATWLGPVWAQQPELAQESSELHSLLEQ